MENLCTDNFVLIVDVPGFHVMPSFPPPKKRLAIYTAFLDRLAVVNRHMIVRIEWVPSVR